MSFTTDFIRNIAIAGHGGTGKTSLTEQILFYGGAIGRPETVESGKTVSDYTEEEIDRKISVRTSLSHITWNDRKINMLDTPGAGDFVGEVIPAFRACESALMLVGAKAGVQIETIKLWRQLVRREKPRMVFVNKMEEERADFTHALQDLEAKFKENFVPVVIPIGNGTEYTGVVDLIGMKAYLAAGAGAKETETGIPASMNDAVAQARERLIECAAEGSDELTEKFLEEGTLSDEEVRTGLIEGLKAAKLVPVFCGSIAKSSGVTPLLNFIATAAPSPVGAKDHVVDEAGDETEFTITPDGPTCALVLKTSIDQFSGRLSFVKVMAGTLTTDLEIFNPRENKKEKLTKLYFAQGKKLEDTREIAAGDIGITAKLTTAHTNDTLCSPDNVVRFKVLQLPQPVHSIAVSTPVKKDEDKLSQQLLRAAEEDLTFQIRFNPATKQTVVSGMGELHINMILDKIRDHQKLEIATELPKIAYRETITAQAAAEYTHKKQSGGHGQYAKVSLEIAPLPRGEGFKFVNAIFGGAISKSYIPGVEKGVVEGMEGGNLAGYPVVDLEAKVVDGKEHPVDSSDMAFKLAARGAFKEAMDKAKPVLLEPVMKLSVFIEEQYLGDVLSDLSAKRGKVLGQEQVGGGIIEIRALVPQAELLRYSIDLRSITSATGSFEVEFDHYNPVTGRIADDIIKAAQTEKQAV